MSSSIGQTSTGMSSSMGQGATGMPNHLYDLVSVLYHALESGATNAKYVQDAQQSGDNDLMQFFQQVQQEERQRAQRAQQLLTQKLSSWQPTH
jgi:hypothetical protein